MESFNEAAFLEHLERNRQAAPIVDRIQNPCSGFDRYRAIREFYKFIEGDRYTPYPFGMDWCSVFTPIEMDMWCEIRLHGIDAYPQYPVGRYFLDFGLPDYKIGLEADGKDWHDAEKDLSRDMELRKHGWTIYRLPGHECVRKIDIDFDDLRDELHRQESVKEFEVWKNSTCDGFLTALSICLSGEERWFMPLEEARCILEDHQLYAK